MTPRYIMLFQYGSNMNPERLNSHVRLRGAAEVVGVARLKGWDIRFDLYSETNQCAVTDIVPSAREYVEGILYKVPYRLVIPPKGQRSRMDVIEGAKLGKESNYKQQKIFVSSNGEEIEARTYVGTVPGRKRFLKRRNEDRRVTDDYFGHVLTGARRFEFPATYIAYLRKQASLE
jgi:Gamma-glutamyl cyclotransferase, AIG2-like